LPIGFAAAPVVPTPRAIAATTASPAFLTLIVASPMPWQRSTANRVPVWAAVVGICIVIIVAAGVIGWIIGQGLSRSCTGPDCGPLSEPLGGALPYTSKTFGYSLDATSRCRSVEMPVTSQDDASIDWTLRFKQLTVNDWPLEVRGEPADSRSAQQIVESIQAAKYADAQFIYSIPMAELGYAPGYGAVYDLRVGAGSANPIHARAVVIAAVKGDLAIILDSLGPFDGQRLGHPFPVQTHGVICFSPVVNSVTWPGESPP
jgi:hypothetical protein